MKTISQNVLVYVGIACLFFAISLNSCKKEEEVVLDNPSTSDTKKNYALIIQNGARTIDQGKNINYAAYLIDKDGNQVSAGAITWSSSGNGGSFSGSIFTATGNENVTITAKVTYEGTEFSASVPLAISLPTQALFTVVPSAIIYETGGSIQLESIYLGTQSASYSYVSGNSSVASVNASGLVSFTGAGSTDITVNATIGGQASVIKIPVLVIATPTVSLPVTKIVVTPGSGEIFKGETKQYSAKAFDASGTDVTSSVSFNWYVEKKDPDFSLPVSITTSGLLTGTQVGEAYVFATAKGIIGQAEVIVNPDTVLMIEPFMASLGGIDPWTGTLGPEDQVFTGKVYQVNRTNYYAGNSNYLNLISNAGNINFYVPLTGIPAVDQFLDLVTLSNATSNSVKATIKPNAIGSTMLIGELESNPAIGSGALINVGF